MVAETVHLFLNPAAGRGRARKRQAGIIALLDNAGIEPKVHNSHAPGHLECQVRQAAIEGAAHIVVAGGDGSIHEAANGLLQSGQDAALGIIPVGTGNDFAKAAHIPLNWEHATRLLADRIQAGQTPRRVDAGRCNERYFANGAGIGFDGAVNRIARQIQLPIGDVVYPLALCRALLRRLTTPVFTIRSDDWRRTGPATLVYAAVGPWVGGMFRIAPDADNTDGLLDLVFAEALNRRRLLALVPTLLRGNHLNAADVQHRRIRNVSIRCSELVSSHLDGEVQPLQSTFDISILPGALRLL